MAEYQTFSEVRARLDEIVTQVRKKDLSLEKSLDLYEEAIKLGNRAAELVDKPDFSDEELACTQGEGSLQEEPSQIEMSQAAQEDEQASADA